MPLRTSYYWSTFLLLNTSVVISIAVKETAFSVLLIQSHLLFLLHGFGKKNCLKFFCLRSWLPERKKRLRKKKKCRVKECEYWPNSQSLIPYFPVRNSNSNSAFPTINRLFVIVSSSFPAINCQFVIRFVFTRKSECSKNNLSWKQFYIWNNNGLTFHIEKVVFRLAYVICAR